VEAATVFDDTETVSGLVVPVRIVAFGVAEVTSGFRVLGTIGVTETAGGFKVLVTIGAAITVVVVEPAEGTMGPDAFRATGVFETGLTGVTAWAPLRPEKLNINAAAVV
jgi:hypothetical protein